MQATFVAAHKHTLSCNESDSLLRRFQFVLKWTTAEQHGMQQKNICNTFNLLFWLEDDAGAEGGSPLIRSQAHGGTEKGGQNVVYGRSGWHDQPRVSLTVEGPWRAYGTAVEVFLFRMWLCRKLKQISSSNTHSQSQEARLWGVHRTGQAAAG